MDRVPIDLDRAQAQHRAYIEALAGAGLDVIELPALDALPDSCFVEDVLVDLGDVRVLTRPGAPARLPEREAMRRAFDGPLAGPTPLVELPEGLRLDGGDVLQVRDVVFVGLSSRTDRDAVAWLATQTELQVLGVPIDGALHLKTAVTALTDNVLVADAESVDGRAFGAFDVAWVHRDERAGANALRLPPRLDWVHSDARDERAMMNARCTHAIRCAQRWGVEVIPVDISEFEKAEAGLTCLSVLLWGEP